MNPFIQFGDKQIYFYSALINLGSVLGMLVLIVLLKHYLKNWKKVAVIFAAQFVLIQLGNSLGKLIRGLSVTDFSDQSKIVELFTKYHGTHFIGRVIFVMIFFPVIYRIVYHRQKGLVEALNAVAVFCIIQHFFNRFACLMNGCCFGSSYDGIGSVHFPEGVAAASGVDYPVYPTQLMEMAGMGILLIILIIGMKKKKAMAPWFCMGFALVIFVSEHYISKMGQRLLFGVSFIQVAAVLLAAIGITLFFIIYFYNKKVTEEKNHNERDGK